MSRRAWALLAAASLTAACGQATQPSTGGLNGTNTVTVVRIAGQQGGVVVDALYGQLAFVTSSRSNDLKAINLALTEPDQPRDYVPAPNPLNSLAIPVVNDPVELAAAVRYGSIVTQLAEFPAGVMDGQVRTGALLFVRGAASPGISVVGAASVPEGLRQLNNGLLLQSAGPVTAITARLTASEQNVVLYYATFDGQDATIWERVLQHPPTTDPGFLGRFPTSLTVVTDCSVPLPVQVNPNSLYVCPPRPVRTYQNAAVSALQVLPTVAGDPPLPVLGGIEGGRLGVGLRDQAPPMNNPTLSDSGQVRIIDPAVPADLDANGTSSDPLFRLVRFFPPFDVQPPLIPGAPSQPPVRQLLTHGRAYNAFLIADGGPLLGPDGGVEVLAYEGARMFGVLDESSCHGSTSCAGILAVDAAPTLADGGTNSNYGLLAFDDSDCITASGTCPVKVGTVNRMLPLQLGKGLVQGVAIESSVTFPISASLGLVPLLGVATVSGQGDGIAQIFFFDALGLRFINTSALPGIVGDVSLVVGSDVVALDAGLIPQTDGGTRNLIDVTVGVGLYPTTESVSIINQGVIPGLGLVPGLAVNIGVLPPYDAGTLLDGGAAPILAWPVPDAGSLTALAVVQPNDLIFPVNLSGTLCSTTTTDGTVLVQVALVQGVDDGGAAIFSGPLDLSQCPGAAGYAVRAGHGSAEPYLVEGSISGLLGRMNTGPDAGPTVFQPTPVFQVPNAITDAVGITYPRFYNPSVPIGTVIDGGTFYPPGGGPPVSTVPLTMAFPAIDDVYFSTFYTTQDAFYAFALSSGFLRASMPIDSIGLGYSGLYLPGGVAATRVRDVHGEFVLVLIAYPSANAVIDFIPDTVLLNAPNAGAITIHF